MRALFGGTPDNGIPATNGTVGNVKANTLFVCGKSDPALLCNHPFSLNTKNYVDGTYQYLEINCGHSVLSCTRKAETSKVVDAIVQHLAKNSGTITTPLNVPKKA